MIYVTTYGDIGLYVLNIGFIYVCSVWGVRVLCDAGLYFSTWPQYKSTLVVLCVYT